MMDQASLDFYKRTVRNLVISTITQSSARDRQRVLGPSDLADPCDYCLGSNFLRSLKESEFVSKESQKRGFSLKAWNGTAVHEKLERDLPLPEEEALKELSVPIREIPGYHMVKGHIDLYLQRMGIWVDYKTTDMAKLKKYRLNGPPESHIRQKMMYGYGLRANGHEANASVLVYIPRDSNRVEDIWEAAAPYSEEWAVDSLERAERIWEQVRSVGVSDLTSDEDACFTCNQFVF